MRAILGFVKWGLRVIFELFVAIQIFLLYSLGCAGLIIEALAVFIVISYFSK